MSVNTISLPSAVSLVVSSMVGVGVFTSVGYQLPSLPSAAPILLLWVLGGVTSLCGALCFAELVAMMPKSGGEYHILREAYHPMAGFLAGWVSVTAGFSAPIAAVAMAFGEYVHQLGFRALSPNVTAAALILLVSAIHFGSVRCIGAFLTVATGLKVALIVMFLAGALVVAPGATQSLAPRGGDLALILSPGFAASLVYVMFAYLGWNGAAYVAGEVRNPQRNLPLAFTLGIVVVMALYLALNAVFLWRTPWEDLAGKADAGRIAACAIFGEQGGWWMGALIAFGLISTVAGFTWSGSRVNLRMGEDFAALGCLAQRNRWGAPVVALLLQTALALVMLFLEKFDVVVNYLMVQLNLSSLLAVWAVVVMRKRDPMAKRPFRTPFYPLPPLVFSVVSLWMLWFQVRERTRESLLGLLTLAAGCALYRLAISSGPGQRKATAG